jgi:hypothetical protein
MHISILLFMLAQCSAVVAHTTFAHLMGATVLHGNTVVVMQNNNLTVGSWSQPLFIFAALYCYVRMHSLQTG